MDLTLKVWRQKNAKAEGHFETYKVKNISADSSFLEMLDILNEQLIAEGIDPVAVEKGCQSSGPVSFDHDCREGICGACAATCKNGSAMLFVAARVSSLALLPQGKVEGAKRAKAMVAKMDELGFGACTNTRACEMECPKHITVSHIARLNREFLAAKLAD